MSGSREYDGDPVDDSWQTAPWNREGETIEASDDDAHEGNMETIDWPENATSKEELNDDQITVIKAAAKYPDINSPSKLTRIAVGDKMSSGYSGNVLVRHWPERYWAGHEDARYSSNVTKGRDNAQKKLTESRVKKIRKMALKGYSRQEIVEELDSNPHTSTVGDAIRGRTWDHVKSPPPLEYDNSKNEYVASEEEQDEGNLIYDAESVGFNNESKEEQNNDTQQSEDTEESSYEPTQRTESQSQDAWVYVAVVAVVYGIYRLIRRLF